jgi:regulator of replication initiation timing
LWVYVCEDHKDKTHGTTDTNSAFGRPKGYHNLAKMSSIAYTRGFIMCLELIGKSFNIRKISLYCLEILEKFK